jgi:hypothetical protein
MKALVVSIALLFAAGCALPPLSSSASPPLSSSASPPERTGSNTRYECSAYQSSTHVLTLPVPSDGEWVVNVMLHGDSIEAVYSEVGLMKNWHFTDEIFIRVKPDMSAQYYDFTSADAGEKRTPEAMFNCRKRR